MIAIVGSGGAAFAFRASAFALAFDRIECRPAAYRRGRRAADVLFRGMICIERRRCWDFSLSYASGSRIAKRRKHGRGIAVRERLLLLMFLGIQKLKRVMMIGRAGILGLIFLDRHFWGSSLVLCFLHVSTFPCWNFGLSGVCLLTSIS